MNSTRATPTKFSAMTAMGCHASINADDAVLFVKTDADHSELFMNGETRMVHAKTIITSLMLQAINGEKIDMEDVANALAAAQTFLGDAQELLFQANEAACRQLAAAGAVPEHYAVVPREPTYQMCEAGGFMWEAGKGFPSAWRAMLAVVEAQRP